MGIVGGATRVGRGFVGLPVDQATGAATGVFGRQQVGCARLEVLERVPADDERCDRIQSWVACPEGVRGPTDVGQRRLAGRLVRDEPEVVLVEGLVDADRKVDRVAEMRRERSDDLALEPGLEEVLRVGVGHLHESGLIEHPDEPAQADEGTLLCGDSRRAERGEGLLPDLAVVNVSARHCLTLS